MRSHRPLSAAVIVVVAGAVLGGLLGRQSVSAQDQVQEQYRVFSAALDAVESSYVGESESDRLVYSAISGMLQTLDPHSNFMDPRAYAQMREQQEGRYYGLGISIQVVAGDIIIANVFEGSPAYEKGLRRGDVIARIGTDDTKDWTSDRAVGRLRGPKGTMVDISIRRAGVDGLMPIQVRRDEVHIPTVPAAVMLDGTTGYIKVSSFGENTDPELGRALKDLTQKGMKRLVFDLRGNPGGALDQAIKVSNRFLPRGDLIVYTRGRVPNSDQDYRGTEQSEYLQIPMVTLVNRDSASASEIVSGALQDHDRSLIVGETTFGKALVQSVYRVSQGAGASITTARYYTPSGRLIQRPWDGTFDEYLMYRFQEQNADKTHRPEDLKYTDGGRKVYSGGGVDPDYRFEGPVDGFNPTKLGRALAARNLFETYAQQFTRRGDTRMSGDRRSGRELAVDFQVTDEMVAEFKALAQKSPLAWDEASWTKDLPFVRAMIRREIDQDLFGMAVAYQNLAKSDPQLQHAVSLFPEAQQLLNLGSQPTRRAAR